MVTPTQAHRARLEHAADTTPEVRLVGASAGHQLRRRIATDITTLLAGGRVLLLTMGKPEIAEAADRFGDHFADPWGRFLKTAQSSYILSCGSETEIVALRAHLDRVHAPIRGAGWRATDDDLTWYTLSVMQDTATKAHSQFVTPLSQRDLALCFEGLLEKATLFGVSPNVMQASYAEHTAYLRDEYETLHVTDFARAMKWRMIEPHGIGALKPFGDIWRDTAIWLLPESARRQYALELSASSLKRLQKVTLLSRRAHRWLPESVWSLGKVTFEGTDALYDPSIRPLTTWDLLHRAVKAIVRTDRRNDNSMGS